LSRIKDCLEKRLSEFKDDGNGAYKIFELIDDITENIREQSNRSKQDPSDSKSESKEISELFLKCLSQLDQQNKNQFVEKSINSDIFFMLFFYFGEKYSLILSECLKSSSSSIQNTILQFLLDNYLLIDNRELVSEIVRFTSNDDKILRDKARSIMYELFPFACPEALNQTFEWDKWWETNGKHFPFTNQLQEVLWNKNAPEKVRLAVLSNLSDRSPSIINNLLKISMDHSDNINVRGECLSTLILDLCRPNHNQPLDDTNAKKILDVINNLLNPAFKENTLIMPMILNILSSVGPINHKLEDTLRNLLSNKNVDDSMKGKICIVLIKSKSSKKLNAEKCLKYYQDGAEKPPRVKDQILYALLVLTGRKDGFNKKTGNFVEDLDFWRKAVSEMPDDPPEEKIKTEK